MKHTQEPWHAHGWSAYGEDGLPIAQSASCYCADTIQGEDWQRFCENSQRDEIEASANTFRIVACVNACAGIGDPAAELARLRRVEGAARTVAGWADPAAGGKDTGGRMARRIELDTPCAPPWRGDAHVRPKGGKRVCRDCRDHSNRFTSIARAFATRTGAC